MASFPPPLPPYTAPFKPLTNITPFTYRDGATYLEKLECLNVYLNETVIPWINDNYTALGDDFEVQVNELITQVNAALAAQTTAVDDTLASVTTELGTKLTAIVPGANVVVVTTGPGSPTTPQIVVPGTVEPTPGTLMARDDAGRSQAVSPVAAADVATKGYVDALVGGGEAGVTTVVAGANINVDSTDAHNPIVSATGLVASVATPSVAHVTDNTGAETTLPYTDAATPSSVATRDASGRVKMVDPIDAADVSTKGYSDAGDSTLQTAKVDKIGTANIAYSTDGSGNQGSTPIATAATASTIVKRDASGRIAVAAPSASGDAATKGYVDDGDATLVTRMDGKSLYGTYASRPAANAVVAGTIYYASDVPEMYYSDATAWHVIGSGGNELGAATTLAAFSASTTVADITGLTATFKVGERPILARACMEIASTISNAVVVYMYLDGASVDQMDDNGTASRSGTRMIEHRFTGLTPGSTHTIKMRCATSTGAGTVGSAFETSLLEVVTC